MGSLWAHTGAIGCIVLTLTMCFSVAVVTFHEIDLIMEFSV